jgi:hypothetical protein
MGIQAANRDYERWLAAQLDGDIVADDLGKKQKKMRDSAFAFLRATYWRWAETILDVCPDLANAPAVLAVGDIHLENFGTWRDAEGRLIWGVNDYDALRKDLEKRKRRWFRARVETATEFVAREYAEWKISAK